MLKYFLVFCFIFSSLSHLEARSIIVPKKKTAIKYFLTLTNLGSKEKTILESDIPEFDLSEDLEGDFSLEISFEDKWGRKIQTPEQKKITFINKLRPTGPVKSEALVSNEKKFILVPYMAYLSINTDIKDQITSKKTAGASTSAKGLRVSFRFFEEEKWKIEIDHFQSDDRSKYLKNSEALISYDAFKLAFFDLPIKFSPALSYAATQSSISFNDQDNLLKTNSSATSTFGFFQVSMDNESNHMRFLTNLHAGSNFYVFRYGISQSFYYSVIPRLGVGVLGDFSRFGNGNEKGVIRGNILKLGINLNFSL